jgi:hypothetical protein
MVMKGIVARAIIFLRDNSLLRPITLFTLLLVIVAFLQFIVAFFQWWTLRGQLRESVNAKLAANRPWILIPVTPNIGNIVSQPDEMSLTLGISYKQSGQSPGLNGNVVAFILRNIGGVSPSEYVKDVTDNRPDCPRETKPGEWVVFNTLSDVPQEVTATSKTISSIEQKPYILICARYDWALHRRYHGRVIMLYQLNGTREVPSLRLLASYAG